MNCVLILVWVEYGLGGQDFYLLTEKWRGLNPCLGGIWSWSTVVITNMKTTLES